MSAIQCTELLEWSRQQKGGEPGSGLLLPLQPYKLVYASLLAECGRVEVALQYCQVWGGAGEDAARWGGMRVKALPGGGQ